MSTNSEFAIGGVHHVALVCSDMERTVDFYSNTLGMPLIKTLEIPGGGQHFFFDCGNGDCVAFFWFPNAPERAPGIAGADLTNPDGAVSAHGSMNHLAFTVPEDRFDVYVDRLKDKGVPVTGVINHDDSEGTVAAELHEGVFVRSVYFTDPDGILLEFACWTRKFGNQDALHPPAQADGTRLAVASPTP